MKNLSNHVKPRAASLLIGLLVIGPGLGFCQPTSAATLSLKITPRFAGEAIQPESLRYQTPAGESFSIARVSYLLSGLALQYTDGSWRECTNAIAWLDLEKNRATLRLEELPAAEFRSLRFHVGLDAARNHADFAKLPADHPLNPNLNGLHWSWQGGYIFLALEGLWRNAAGVLEGWSFHLARDPNRIALTLPVTLHLTNDLQLELDFDLATLLRVPQPLSFAKDGASTHSREGDPIAAALVANLPGAFTVRRIAPLLPSTSTLAQPKPLYLPEKFTPYPFEMSAYFPIPDLPRDNPLTTERVTLGETLFREPLLSKDGTISCASCHEAPNAFTDARKYSLGVRGQIGTRNAMPLFNLAWKSSFFWDGRAPSLRAQALMPIQDHSEMDETLTNVVAKLQRTERETATTGTNSPFPPFSPAPLQPALPSVPESPSYSALFTAAFGSPEITPEKVGLALEAFMLTLTSFDSRFDRVLKGEEQLTEEEQRGLTLFMTEYDPRRGQFGADCFHCHAAPLFQSQAFANNGLDSTFADPGRAKVTGKVADRGKFSTPSLRNIALTAPYMHDGRFQTLEEVVAHYTTGVKRSPTLDPNLAKHPDGGVPLSAADQRALVAFLRTLTDSKFFTATRAAE